MRRIRLLLWPAGIAIGLAGERTLFGWDEPGRWTPDLVVGWTFISCGLIAWTRRPESRSGMLMTATGFAWFLPNFGGLEGAFGIAAAATLFWHRGPLVHLVLTYPEGRASSWLTRSGLTLAYAAAVLYPVWRNDVATIAFVCFFIVVSAQTYRRSIGPARRAHGVALWAMITLSSLFGGEALVRLAGPTHVPSEILLVVYEATLCAIAIGLTIALLRRPWERASVTDLVVEIGETRSGSLRDELASALGDPSLEVGYWVPEKDCFVDAEGRSVDPPTASSERAMTTVERDGQPIAVLVHDRAVLSDPGLVEAVSAASKLAVSNARLQAELRGRQTEIRESRQRLVEAGDDERRRLERHLRVGALQRLEDIAATLREARGSADGATKERIALAEARLAGTQEDIRRLARGLHPHELTDRGLAGALASLIADAPLPVELGAAEGSAPRNVEACAYYVCSEALANLVKHAHASAASMSVSRDGDCLIVQVEDDGVGGADPLGSGLRGLADRVEALSGTLAIDSPPGRGTRISARIPINDRTVKDRSQA